jgi:flagellar basal-body rod protein FlgB
MSIGALPLIEKIRTRMHWHQERQKLLAENVVNADVPNFRPRDLKEPSASGMAGLQLAMTQPGHRGAGGAAGADPRSAPRFETTPGGNGVNLEEEMLKTAQNQSDYALATSLYQKNLALLRKAVGKGR